MKVPPLSELREMDEADLLRLRTEVAADLSSIEAQIRFDSANADDPEWVKKASIAAHKRQQGLGMIKNVLAERTLHRPVLLHHWLITLQRVVDAAIATLDEYVYDDDDEVIKSLRDAVASYREFTVDMDEVPQ